VLGIIAIATVAVLLAATALRQVGQVGPRGRLLDAMAVLPQWKFFGQSHFGVRQDVLDDLHLVARDWTGAAGVGPWRPVFSPPERRWTQAIFGPPRRADGMLLSFADDLAARRDAMTNGRVTTSLAYLVLLRHCLDALPRSADAQARQFAIVRTRGRGQRELSIPFVSHWHEW
jgi:hypothetical protein